MCLVRESHEAIIDKEMFNEVQKRKGGYKH